MQDLLAFNCLTWLFVNENPVVNYSIENIMVSQLWMADILVNSCKDWHSWFQLSSDLITIVFLYMMNSNLMIKNNCLSIPLWNIDVSFRINADLQKVILLCLCFYNHCALIFLELGHIFLCRQELYSLIF